MENGTSARSYLIPLLGAGLFGVFLFSGCIEHRYFYKFNLDGSCDLTYRAKGDSSDIYDEPRALPDSLVYAIRTFTEKDTNGTDKYVLEAKATFRSGKLPRTLGLKEVPWTEVFLHNPAQVKRTRFFFCTLFSFEADFKGRDRIKEEGDRWKYIPEECRPLEDPQDTTLSDTMRAELEKKYAAGMLIWNAERYKMRFRQILKQSLELHPEIKVPQGWMDSALAEVDSLINAYTAGMQIVDLNTVKLEWWKELAPAANLILAENLNILGGDSTLQAEIRQVGEILELRHLVSEDLADESFEVRVDLPGRIMKSNTTVMEEGDLIWKFTGSELDDQNVLLQAGSLYIYTYRVVATLLIVVLLLVYRKFKKSKATALDGPPPPPKGVR
ncbi:MAG: hypothetical protein NTW14_04030 [bacterium]|nr:hypothetical protein [bacterium]